jgi:hypothetical protein
MKYIFTTVSIASFLLTGCASITSGTSQTLIFNISPTEARCELTRTGDGRLGIVTSKNTSIEVSKDKDDILVVCNAPGYIQDTQRIVSSATTAGVTGVLLDFGITDMITGAMYKYPQSINISLEKS